MTRQERRLNAIVRRVALEPDGMPIKVLALWMGARWRIGASMGQKMLSKLVLAGRLTRTPTRGGFCPRYVYRVPR